MTPGNRSIPESDWKKFRAAREGLLQQFCENVLARVSDFVTDEDLSPPERYQALYEYLDERGNDMARIFSDPRRSNALFQLAGIQAEGLLDDALLAEFTQETQQSLADIASTGH